jgi:hypothetical protein
MYGVARLRRAGAADAIAQQLISDGVKKTKLLISERIGFRHDACACLNRRIENKWRLTGSNHHY